MLFTLKPSSVYISQVPILRAQILLQSRIRRHTFPTFSTMSTRASKRQKTDTNEPYHLLYWPHIPGRGEHIRLALEQAGATYTDTAHNPGEGIKQVLAQISDTDLGDTVNPPTLAPPVLKHGEYCISQTPNILMYLGPKLGLAPSPDQDPIGIFHINQLTMTALDGLSNEPHDTHHPIAVMDYYEDQKEEALKKATDYRKNRLPKFLGYFQRVLSSESSKGGEYLYGGSLSYADLVLFQTLDGVSFAFPRRVAKLKESGKYDKVFEHQERIKGLENIKAYLESDRRQKYSKGIYRHYPELDGEE